jgi:phosphoenolpyruvate carboxylase
LHIGLFGYSRNVEGIALPRAITFAASLYSLGIPPEFIGLSALNELTSEEQNLLAKYYVNLNSDLNAVSGYLSWQNINMLMNMYNDIAKRANMNEENLRLALTMVVQDIKVAQMNLGINFGPRSLELRKYENTVSNFLISYIEQIDESAKEYLEEAAQLRKSLG